MPEDRKLQTHLYINIYKYNEKKIYIHKQKIMESVALS